jgi:hypothetical protein
MKRFRIALPDPVYELLVIVWIVLSPLAIARWVQHMEDPVTWAAFAAGVLGVVVGWLVVAPQQAAKSAREAIDADA